MKGVNAPSKSHDSGEASKTKKFLNKWMKSKDEENSPQEIELTDIS